MLVDQLTKVTTHPGDAYYKLFQKFPLDQKLSLQTEEVVNEHLHSCHLLMRENKPLGRFALYINPVLSYQGMSAICIGAYACIDDAEVSSDLLSWAEALCADLGYQYCLGPMSGSTWYSYRLSNTKTSPSFGMDIYNPQHYPRQFEAVGFVPIAAYVSNVLLEDALTTDSKHDFVEHFKKKGINIRNIDLNNLEQELSAIAAFSNEAFKENFLFTPLGQKKFVHNYSKLKCFMAADFIWIAEDKEKNICSILFAIRDASDPTSKSLIIKTIAARKGYKYQGLTTFLTQELTKLAFQKGFEKIIHAFMHKDNSSFNFSKKTAQTINEYALYGKKIQGNN